jgi:hypothetical protein
VALYGLEMLDRAALAFETSLCFPAHSWRAHGWLAHIHRRRGLGDRAEQHRALWKSGFVQHRRMEADLAEAKTATHSNEPFDEEPAILDTHPLLVLTGLPHSGFNTIAALLKAGGLRIVLEEHQLSSLHFAVDERTVLLIPYSLLPQLPKTRPIRVIVSDRRVEEVIASKRREQAAQRIRPPRNTALEGEFLQFERDASLKALGDGANFRTLVVDMDTPEISVWIQRIQEFLVPLSLDIVAMREAVNLNSSE